MAMFCDIVKTLQEKTPLSISSFTNIRNKALRACILQELSKNKGFMGNPLFSEPFFEVMFPWEMNSETVADQVQNQKVHQVIQKLHLNDQNEELTNLYKHQAKAIEAIRQNKSIVVTTGTGSGKTECFLYPIFDYLARKFESSNNRSDSVDGVQALFLYPLNALIESQADRFKVFCERFNNHFNSENLIRFANYTGKMGETVAVAADHKHLDCPREEVSKGVEIQDRTTMRATPPQLLITNATILEYSLIRQKDQPLFETFDAANNRKKTLKFVVLDEAHNYTGSNAAELKMRLKRVLLAFGCEIKDVLFIATSATAGKANEIKQFLAEVTGVDNPENNIEIISGRRNPKPIQEKNGLRPSNALEQMKADPENAEHHFEILEQTPSACKLRKSFEQTGKPTSGRKTLEEIRKYLSLNSDTETLEFLDFASLAKKDKQYFLPLKMHLFQKEFNGVWACCNPECNHKQDIIKDDPDWKFGKIYFEADLTPDIKKDDTYICDCGHSLLQVLACRNCGFLHLAGKFEYSETEDDDQYLLKTPKLASDLSVDDLDFEEDEFADGSTQNQTRGTTQEGPALLVVKNDSEEESRWYETTYINRTKSIQEGSKRLVFHNSRSGCRCPNCKLPQNIRLHMNDNGTFPTDRNSRIQNFVTPSKVLYNSLVKDVLVHDPITEPDAKKLPLYGRKLLSFTDSRQGAAYYAGSQGLRSEIEATRIWLWNAINKLDEDEILDYESACDVVAKNIKPIKSYIHLPETYKETSEQQLAELFLWREFTFRSRKKCSLETLGLVQVHYELDGTNIQDLCQRPNEISDLISTDHFKNFVKILLDYGFRKRGSLNCFNYNLVKDAFGSGISIKAFDLSDYQDSSAMPSILDEVGKIARYYVSNNPLIPLSNPEWVDIKKLIRYTVLQLVKTYVGEDDEKQFILEAARNKNGDIISNQYVIKPQCMVFKKTSDCIDVCPATKTLLDTPVLGKDGNKYSPYIVSISDAEHRPITESVSLDNILHQKEVEELENTALWWIDFHQNVLSTGPKDIYMAVQEDTAQIDSKKRVQDQRKFKKGKINILNCSTTMEMGVDIGGISLVAHTNVPPHEYNYLQRAGRAGRASQGQSFIWTLVGFGAHEHKAAENPLKWVCTNTLRQGLNIVSDIIQQRHINAYLLGAWIKSQSQDINFESRLRAFYLVSTDNPEWKEVLNMIDAEDIDKIGFTILASEKFNDLLDQISSQSPYVSFDQWLDTAKIPNELLMGKTEASSKDAAKQNFKHAFDRWKKQLKDYYELLSSNPDEDVPVSRKEEVNEETSARNQDDKTKAKVKYKGGLTRFQKSTRYHLKQCFNGYGLSFLIEDGALPSNGMPVDVVEMEQPKSSEENPSRERKIAIREFAPGATIIRNGVRYTSRGLTLNWKPYNGQGQAEPTVIAKYYTCPDCNSPWCSLYDANPGTDDKCSCGYNFTLNKAIPRKILEPVGFRADEGNLSLNEIIKPPYEPAHIKFTGPKTAATAIPSANIQAEYGKIKIFYLNGNTHAANKNIGTRLRTGGYQSADDSYHLCLKCGFVAQSEDGFNSQLHKTFSRNYGMPCDETSSSLSHKIISLAAIIDSCGISIAVPQLNALNNPQKAFIAANTWGLVLRNALADKLKIDYSEIGWAVQLTRKDSLRFYSIVLFDSAVGGADLCYNAKDCLPELFMKARELLKCSDNCENVCLNCLLSQETQVMASHLNRLFALEFLGNSFFNLLEIPQNLKLWGNSTKLGNDYFHYCKSALDAGDVKKVRFYLPEDASMQHIEQWPMISEIIHNEKAELVVSQKIFNEIKADIDTYDFATELCCRTKARNFQVMSTLPAIQKQFIAAEVIHSDGNVEQSVMLAKSDESYTDELFANSQNNQFICGTPQRYMEPALSTKKLQDVFDERNEFTSKHTDIYGRDSFEIGNFATSILQKLGIADQKWVTMDYSDAFLNSPLAIRIFLEFAKAINASTIRATTMEQFQSHQDRAPYIWYRQYTKEQIQDIFKNIFANVPNKPFATIKIKSKDRTKNSYDERNLFVKHDRIILLQDDKGKRFRLKFTGSFTQFKLEHELPEVQFNLFGMDQENDAREIINLDSRAKIKLKDANEEMTVIYNEL